MRDFEKPRFAAAASDFAKAFEKGYATGKRARADGADLANVGSVINVDVPRDDVLNGEHLVHCAFFEEAGSQAGLAVRRTREAKLDATESDPDGVFANRTRMLRWVVILNPVDP